MGRFSRTALAIQVFTAGFVIMVLELLGSRILTPVYGNTINTWGGIIGVVMSGLALGYYMGGVISTRTRDFRVLSVLMILSSFYVIIMASVDAFILSLLSPENVDDRLGVISASLFILGPPTVLLGAIPPISVRLISNEIVKTGRSAGFIYALSTLGSIAGTFMTTYLLIPMLDIRTVIYLSSLTLFAVSSMTLRWRYVLISGLVMIFLIIPINIGLYATCISSYIGEVVYRDESLYSQIAVVDRGNLRYLYLNGLLHSVMDVNDPYSLVAQYTKFFILGPLLRPDSESVLFIGGGGFSTPKHFLKYYDFSVVDVVEIDPEVVEVARRYFNLSEDQRLGVYVLDGRRYLSITNRSYDLIIIDAYSKNYIPFHMLTLEFVSSVKSRLKDDGVVMLNIISSLSGPTSDVLWATYKIYRLNFRYVYVIPVTSSLAFDVQNLILLASDHQMDVDLLTSGSSGDGLSTDIDINKAMQSLIRTPYREDVPLLTDEFAPIEFLINPITGTRFGREYYLGIIRPSICG
ncbi:MAG: fused MFS/spermidine synthase [Aigarchaeota archaeon]|nr:fused MFS/spermidine synthase [Aigarchaeota archaeon]MDW8092885.1 fused MFS/spermidine synthase [Nitrososphaerota archaeon]